MNERRHSAADGEVRTVPNFFIVGAMKCGTTAWVDYLGSRPDVSFGLEKEPRRFDEDLKRVRPLDAEQYAALYAGCDERVVGDASVFNLFSDIAAQKIRAFNPGARILILLRDHLSFLRSYHNHLVYLGIESEASVEVAYRLSADRRAGQGPYGPNMTEPRLLDYEAVMTFAPQVRRYLDVFPEEQVRVAWLTDWSGSERLMYSDLLQFLGLQDDGKSDFAVVNAAPKRRFEFIDRLLVRVRRPASAIAGPLRRLRGGRKLQIYRRLRELNTVRGTKPAVSEAFAAEITARYAADVAEVNEMIRSVRLPMTPTFRQAAS